MRTVLLACLVVTLLSSIPGDECAATEPEAEVWYGWQILISGSVSLTLFSVGLAIEDSVGSPLLTTVGALGYGFGGPINHWARDHTAKGFGSLGLTLGLPTVAGLIGGGIVVALYGEGGDIPSFPIGFAIGAGVGAVAAIIVDAVVFGHEPTAPPGAVSVGISATPGGVGLGLGGRF
jgi:hypothetical protein